ncbi:MAG TPA: pseudouridine synthase [Blastocatellia bacterium]|nr:pseudouridine synthase [Blastocatellia bacterium]
MEERLQKIIASAGVASRRGAEELVISGEVTINGEVVTRLGTKADPERDHIKVRGKLINPKVQSRTNRYFLLNKPKGYVSATSDPEHRPVVLDLLPPQERKGLHLVGRLDLNSEGLIILTNDGELTRLLTQAGKVPKVYKVKVHSLPAIEQIARLKQGGKIGTIRVSPSEIRLTERTREGGNAWYEVTLLEGKNQQIRRMFDSIGHPVSKLRRTRIGHLTDKGLDPGHFRELKPSEIARFFGKTDANAKPSRNASQKRRTRAGAK